MCRIRSNLGKFVASGNYRPEVDGLRTVAVLAVLFYHAGFSWMPGGFVGVDVFFVISGYLITRKIWTERLSTGTFNFSKFYIGRIRRLFPALYVTATASLVSGYFLFPPDLMKELAMSVITSLLSVSNFFFWSHSGYFDTANQLRPLLHTWSLSVEEQFYLVWPLLIVFLAGFSSRRITILALTGVCIASLILSIIYLADRASIYYLLPFRVFELGIGALLVFADRHPIRDEYRKAAASSLGLAGIVACCLLFNEKTVFPSYNALLPCVATALVIYAGRPVVVGWLLTNRLVLWIGAMSYSLYLVHWPIMVFYRYQVGIELGVGTQASLVFASLFAATILYTFIENPIRRGGSLSIVPGWKFGVGLVAAYCIGIAPAWAAWSQHGWPWRYSPEILSLMDKSSFEKGAVNYPRQCFMSPPMSFNDVEEECYKSVNNGKKNILILGDSTAYHLVTGLHTLLKDEANVLAWASSQCPAVVGFNPSANPQCNEIMGRFFSVLLRENDYDLVIVSSHGNWDVMQEKFEESLSLLREHGADVVIVGQTIVYDDSVHNIVARSLSLDRVADALQDRISIGCGGGEHGMDQLTGSNRFFSMKEVLCSGGNTPIFGVNGTLIYRDRVHFNGYGSVFIAKTLVGWLRDRFLLQ